MGTATGVVQSNFACYQYASLSLILAFFGIVTAVPTSSPVPIASSAVPDITTIAKLAEKMVTAGTTASMAISTQQSSSQNFSQVSISRETGPPAIVNNENVTETEIVITEASHGKSLHPHHNQDQNPTNQQQNLISKSNDGDISSTSNVTSTEKGVPGSSSFEATKAIDGDHTVQRINEGDAPPKPEGKPQELQEQHLLFVTTTEKVQTERDKMVQRIFGGTCGFANWNRCSRIEFWGDEYLVPDKKNPGNFIVKRNRIDCREKPTLCLKNGWTVARCHLLCMSQCNVEYRMEYDKHVLHEGECKWPILK